MIYTNLELIKKYGSIELNMFMGKYLSRYKGSRMEVNHSSYLLSSLGANDEVVAEFKLLHENKNGGIT